jgi:Phosphotransferase enzyme family
MAFLKTHNVPVPKVYDWSASAENSVGSESMIMEKVPGTGLEQTWYSMTREERFDIVEKIVRLEKALSDIPLPAFGSIYFRDSLPAEIRTVDIPDHMRANGSTKFCIGPSTETLWWYSGRTQLEVNMGPC